MSRLGVVVNPVAGNGRGTVRGREVLGALARSGHEVMDLSAPDADTATGKARAALGEIDALVVVGGDGMVHLGVNAVAGSAVPLAVVAVGNGNDFARTMGLPVQDVAAALRLLDRGVAPRSVDLIACRVHRAGEAAGQADVQWAACVVSAGFDAAVNERANAYTWPHGTTKYVRGLLAELRGFTPYGYRLTVDGVTRELPGTLVALANTPSFGGGMRIAPDAVVDDGLIDVVVASAVGRARLLRLFPRVYSGTHVRSPVVSVVRAREVLIEPLEGHPPPPVVFADGERVGPLPLHARVVPGALMLIAETAP